MHASVLNSFSLLLGNPRPPTRGIAQLKSGRAPQFNLLTLNVIIAHLFSRSWELGSHLNWMWVSKALLDPCAQVLCLCIIQVDRKSGGHDWCLCVWFNLSYTRSFVCLCQVQLPRRSTGGQQSQHGKQGPEHLDSSPTWSSPTLLNLHITVRFYFNSILFP